MAIKLVDETTLNSNLTSVANAIRSKTGGTSSIAFPAGFVSEIEGISSGGSDSSNYSRILDYREITFQNTATSSNKLTVQLTPVNYYLIIVMIDTYPSAPDASEYIALAWKTSKFPEGTGASNGDILRPAGTIGSDSSMCSFNNTTGILSLGGSYGHFLAGTKYHVYLFNIEV